MRKLLIGLTVVVSLVFAAPAMGWDQQECDEWYDKHGTPHQDCEAPPKPPEEEAPPVVVPPVVAPPVVTPPVVTPPSVTPPAPPVVPPTPTPTPPAPPVAPPAEDEVPDLTDDSPDVPEKSDRDEGEAGQTEDRRDRLNIPAAPQVQTRTVSSTEGDTLPYTGAQELVLLLMGSVLLGGGVLLRRRSAA